jgi:hypothetical protein
MTLDAHHHNNSLSYNRRLLVYKPGDGGSDVHFSSVQRGHVLADGGARRRRYRDGQKTMFKNVMRAMAVFMVPMTASMPAGLFVYWSASNTFSVVQTAVLKSKVMKKILKLPEPPKDAMLNIKSPFQNISEVRRWLSFCEVLHRSLTDSNAVQMLKKEMAVKDTATAEIVDGSRPTVVSAPPPPSTLSSTPPGRKPKAASSP